MIEKMEFLCYDKRGILHTGGRLKVRRYSPIVISSAKEANVILLDEEKEATYLPDSYGYKVDDVLKFRQESIIRPKNIQNLVNMIDAAVEDEDFVMADSVLIELKDIMGVDNTEYKKIAGIVELFLQHY